MQYPLFAGYKENTTSREAANAIEASGKAKTLREKVEVFFATGRSATADEVAEIFGERPLSVRPRISELYQLGKIERTGERRASSEGKPSHVYRAKVTA
jgi:predicted ArsR family transcriptional regulator